MNDNREIEQLLRSALRDEAARADVDPRGLEKIQERTSEGTLVSLRSRRRRTSPWITPVLVSGAAAATVFGVVTLVDDGSAPDQLSPAGPSRPSAVVARRLEGSIGPTRPGTVYYVGDAGGGVGPRVYSERRQVPATGGVFPTGPIETFFSMRAYDSDYSTLWPAGVEFRRMIPLADRGYVEVYLAGDADLSASHGITPEEADAAIDAFVRTVGLGSRVKVYYNGTPVKVLLGRRIDGFATTMPRSQALAPVQVTSLTDGAQVGRRLIVRGQAQVFEGTVTWQMEGPGYGRRGKVRPPSSSSYVTVVHPDKRSRWSETFADLQPGTYRFKAYEQSPETGRATYVDDKTFTVR